MGRLSTTECTYLPTYLPRVLGCVCACARAPLVPRHSWLGCAAGVFVLGLGFRLRPATPGWGVGVCVCLVRAPLVPRHSWLGCAVWASVFGLWLWLLPAFPGLGVECACLCARSACTPPLLAGVCGVGVCAWGRGSAVPRHSWLGCSGVCVFVCALCLYPATPGWGVRCGCVCLRSGFGCAPPLLAGVLGPVWGSTVCIHCLFSCPVVAAFVPVCPFFFTLLSSFFWCRKCFLDQTDGMGNK